MKHLIDYLETFITDQKKEKIRTALAWRTRYVTLVLEDLYHHQNINAIIRSAECFGLQDLHIIEQEHSFAVNLGITKGASDWTSVYRSGNTPECFQNLKKNNYRIIATSPHATKTLDHLDLDQKLAIVVGTEETGLSPFALQQADECVSLPMFGFTGSFNVSISAALCLQNTISRLHLSPYLWQLTDHEREELHLLWLRRLVRGSAALEQRWYENYSLTDQNKVE